MSSSTLLAVILIAGVALLALWLRSQSVSGTAQGLPAPRPGRDLPPGLDAGEGEEEEEELEFDESACVTVDGIAFIGEEHGVSLVPTPDPMSSAPGPIVPIEFLRHGDFSGARVVRGAPDVDPWRLELLGPEGEYLTFGFAGEQAARGALALLESRDVMEYVTDDDGRPIAPSAEQFEEARRRRDETERLLALGEAEGGEPLH